MLEAFNLRTDDEMISLFLKIKKMGEKKTPLTFSYHFLGRRWVCGWYLASRVCVWRRWSPTHTGCPRPPAGRRPEMERWRSLQSTLNPAGPQRLKKQKQTLFSTGSAQSTPTFIELKTNLLLIALLFMYCRPILSYYPFQQTHKSCSRLITRVWKWRWRDFHRVQMPHVKGGQCSDRQEKDERDIRFLQTASVFCFTSAWKCIMTNKKQNKIKTKPNTSAP